MYKNRSKRKLVRAQRRAKRRNVAGPVRMPSRGKSHSKMRLPKPLLDLRRPTYTVPNHKLAAFLRGRRAYSQHTLAV